MNRETFERLHAEDWRRLESALDAVEKGEQVALHGFPALYRRICHHLALARARSYGLDLERRLNRLALGGHNLLYHRASTSWATFVRFLRRDFPRMVRAEWRLVLLCGLFFYGPLLGMWLAARLRPELAYSVLSPGMVDRMEGMYAEGISGRPAGGDLLMFGYYVYNNVGIAFRTFAGGIFCGIGAVFVLLYNGLVIGSVTGYLHHVGHGPRFFPFVIGHGAFELTAIVLAGVAGLRIGLAVLAPGRRSRARALLASAKESLGLVYGVALMLLLAAFVEAFWSSSSAPAEVKLAAGGLAWAAVGAYFVFAGRRGRAS